MKTLTEFSALVLRKAAEARAKAPAPAAAPAAPPVEAASSESPAAEASPEGSAEASSDASAEASADASPEASADASAEPASEGEAAPAAAPAAADPAIDFVAAELGVQPDRAARLLEALDIIGNRMDEVRLVRVYQGEKGPHNAVSRGEYHYAIDKVAGAPKRDRGGRGDDRRGGERRGGGGGGGGPGGGGGGFGGRGGRDKPRGLGSLKVGAAKEDKDPRDDRPGRGEMPRAGIGWQLTAAPRDFGGGGPGGRGRGGPKRGRGPGRPGDDRGPRGPRDDRGRGGPRGPRGPRPEGEAHAGERPNDRMNDRPNDRMNEQRHARPQGGPPPGPRLGPDGQPLPPREKRPRKPMGPDANGLGPDGTPWDPERRAKRQAERDATRTPEGQPVNTQPTASVEAETPAKSE